MVLLWSLLYLGRISSSIYSKYHLGLLWSLLRCCIQISKLKNLKGFLQGQMIQMPTWKYDIIELMNMYVFITLKKNTFSSKKNTPKGSISLQKQPKKRSQKKVRNNTESKKNTQTTPQYTNTIRKIHVCHNGSPSWFVYVLQILFAPLPLWAASRRTPRGFLKLEA